MIRKSVLFALVSLFSVFAYGQEPITQDSIPEPTDFIPTITLTDADLDDDQDEGISGLLSASKDIFVRLTDFNLNAGRFRVRGYDSENVYVYLNGVKMNVLESGWTSFSHWGGLNDMVKSQEINTGLEASNFSFSSFGGAVNIDTRASSQWKQLKATYTSTNRNNYNNRAMLSWSSGMMENDFAVSLMGSRRWAQEGYVEGTFYDGYSYFLSVDKKINNHLLNLSIIGASADRGKSGAAVQEMYDLAGTNYYNPYWGFQAGEKRNARVAKRHEPLAILRHDWEMNESTTLTTTVNVQDGKNGSSNLDWYDAGDPRPDYYRKLPSAVPTDSEFGVNNQLILEQLLTENQAARQINWDQLYEINRNAIDTDFDPNMKRSKYAVMDRRYDAFKANFSTLLQKVFSEKFTLVSGLNYQYFKGDNYQLMTDLLGGDYIVNLDQFAERDFPNDEDIIQHDLDNPNALIKEGDRFGYNYESHIRQASGWAQGMFSLGRLQFHLGAEVMQTSFWRNGINRNGKFPESSQGESEKVDFTTYGVKAGLNYALDGRNFLVLNGKRMTRPPVFRDAFVSARTRNQVVPGLKEETIFGGEFAYLYKSPNLNAKIGAFYTRFEDQTEIKNFYHDDLNTFVNFIMSGVDKEHIGLELAAEGKIVAGLTYKFAASLGQFIYDSRPTAIISQDNNAGLLAEDKTVYIKNFYVPGTPQKAGLVGLEYATPSELIIGVNGNFFSDFWLDFNPDRRSFEAIEVADINNAIEEGSELWNEIIFQEKAPSAFTLDVSIRRKFRLQNDWSLSVNCSVNNILNNLEFINGGYEQLRFDFEEKNVDKFPAKYYYSRGINYFLNLVLTKRL